MMKTLTASQLATDLNAYIDPNTMSDFGPNGLSIMNEGPLTKIGTAVTPDLKTIETAIDLKVNALLLHHGFKLGELYPLTDKALYKKIKLLMLNNIAVLRYHLPLDAHHEIGNNWKAARDLGWQNLEPFGEYNNSFIGVRGTFAPTSFGNFVATLERYYGNKATVVETKKTISSAAIVSGGADKLITQAAHAGVDCYVTGTFDEPVWYVAGEENISFCALGHAATEKVGPKALAEYCQKTYAIESVFIDTANPF